MNEKVLNAVGRPDKHFEVITVILLSQPGVLPLKPGPLYAIDGDSGINEEITYSFLSGI